MRSVPERSAAESKNRNKAISAPPARDCFAALAAPAPTGRCGMTGSLLRKILSGLQDNDLAGLQSLGAALDVELDPLAFVQRAIALGLNRGVVDKHVLAAFTRDEAVPLGGVEPLDGALRSFVHSLFLLLRIGFVRSKRLAAGKEKCPPRRKPGGHLGTEQELSSSYNIKS